MERTITEATQGCEITEYCDRSKLDFLNMGVSNEININNSYKTGYAKYPYQIFNVDVDFEFKEVKDVSNLSDEEILNYFICDVIGEEYEILVRNVSYSQLKSFHIIIPGMSEMSSGDDEGFVLISRSRIAEYLINNPQDIDENGCNILLYVLLMVSKMQLTCSLSNLSGTLLHEEYLPGEEYHLGWLFMIVMCYVYKGDYMKAYEKMKLFVEICEGADYTIKAYYKAIEYYLQAVVGNVGNHHQIIQYMKVFFDKDVVKKLEKNFEDNKLIFVKHYIIHDTKTCQSKGCCDYHVFEELQEKHRQLMKKSNIEQLALKKIFS
jgi:ribosomal protein S12 methylthiotransferase accessory factor